MSLLTDREINDIGGKFAWANLNAVEPGNAFARAVEAAVIRKLATVNVEPVVNVSNDGWIIVTGTGLAPGAKLVPVEALAAARVQLVEKAVALLKGIDYCETDADDGWWETSYQAEFGKQKLDAIRALIGVNK